MNALQSRSWLWIALTDLRAPAGGYRHVRIEVI